MTYSITARCPRTGEYGVAVATYSPTVGNSVPLIVPGCGAVAYALPLCLELAGEGLPDLHGLDARSTGLALSLSVGLASALLYVVPIVFFYTYYRALAVTPTAIEPKEQL